jgi:hypothetical protein
MAVLSLGEFLWSLLVIFFMVTYFMMLFHVIFDVFRRRDASGWKKAAWLVFLFCAPFIGLIAYMVTNPVGMAQRASQGVAGGGSPYVADGAEAGPATEIGNAKALLDSGAISEDEYVQIKSRVLAV